MLMMPVTMQIVLLIMVMIMHADSGDPPDHDDVTDDHGVDGDADDRDHDGNDKVDDDFA